jgi:hypothetical protein
MRTIITYLLVKSANLLATLKLKAPGLPYYNEAPRVLVGGTALAQHR